MYTEAERILRRSESNKRAKQRKKDWYLSMKTPCVRCGDNIKHHLSFHHIDPTTKAGNIARMLNNSSKQKIADEIAKCISVCHNCHSDIHHEEGYYYGAPA